MTKTPLPSSYKRDYFRTPGQILSLRSNLGFVCIDYTIFCPHYFCHNVNFATNCFIVNKVDLKLIQLLMNQCLIFFCNNQNFAINRFTIKWSRLYYFLDINKIYFLVVSISDTEFYIEICLID